MKLTIEHMQVTSQELKKIAYKFMQVDNEQGNLDPRCASPQTLNSLGMSNVHYEKAIKEKSFGDHVNELGMEFKAFGVGVQAAAAEMWDSAKDTANALIEEPVETGKQMAYNATIGTAEEIVKTTIWGAKMALDIGDTREKFGEEIQAEQELINEMGTSTYLGQQAAMIFGGFALKRLGVKDTPNLKKDSGGDGGKGGAGTGDLNRVISSIDDLSDSSKSMITTSQRATVYQQERTYSHLTAMDLKGAQRDLDGNPVPKPGGGYYDHAQEVSDAYCGLVDLKKSWEGMLKNPNSDTELRQLYTSKLNEVNNTMKKMAQTRNQYLTV
ncbi:MULTISPECIES: polymorphic toxin type 28 domain-containing protein [Paenibacillus]|uniref:polymorphic toxin type 28 domain-containing protein n=1 Tax=Paenibacillus TaxID=44249 RepID=UPI0011A56619|nr:polymorphic toxin type 28 domain-containing protein [Paenibacillus sp. IHBB 10380]